VPAAIFEVERGSTRNDEASDLSAYGRAQRVCSRCPVRRRCLADAITNEGTGLAFGVWGGVPAEQRLAARKEGRPLDESLDMLEIWFREQAQRWLLPDEEIV
jgi:hypothetical protein